MEDRVTDRLVKGLRTRRPGAAAAVRQLLRLLPAGGAALVAAAGVAAAAPGAAAASPPAGDESHALKHLKELDDAKLAPLAKAKLGLRLYRMEMLNPTRPGQAPLAAGPRPVRGQPGHAGGAGSRGHPLGGGGTKVPGAGYPLGAAVRTHDYVLAKITERLAERNADVKFLKLTWEKARDGEVKDCLAVFLGLKGQAEAKDPVSAIAVDRKKPLRVRELAARALGELAVKTQDSGLGEVLAKVIREDAHAVYRAGKTKDGKESLVLVFPVRRAAVAAVRKMEKQGMLLASYVTAAAEGARVEVEAPRAGR